MTAISLPNVKYSCEIVMDSVRDSSLNYSMRETPFSLYLTIRKTFVKSSSTLDQNSSVSLQNFASTAQDNFTEIKDLESKLRAAEESQSRLKNLYEQAVEDSEATHAQVKELEKLLEDVTRKVNLESVNKMESEMKIKDCFIEKLKVENENVENDLQSAEKNWKELKKLIKMKEKEVHDLRKENKLVTENLDIVSNELKNITNQVNKEKKVEAKKLKRIENKEFIETLKAKPEPFACSSCDLILESLGKLKQHVISFHVTSISTQTSVKVSDDKSVQSDTLSSFKNMFTQTFEESDLEVQKYPCYYCGINIVSENHLNAHRIKCRGMSREFGELGLPPKVPSFSTTSAETNMNEALALYLLHQETLARKFQCDICLNNFDSESLLGMHRVFTHSRLKVD